MASARQVARQFGLPASTVRAIDLRYLERWNAARRKPVLRQMGVDEIYLGKKQKFLSVVCNLETGEPLWFGQERKKETLDGFFQTELSAQQRRGIQAACLDMWKPYRLSIEQWAPNCQIIYDKFHIMQHANKAVDEVRRAEFFRKGEAKISRAHTIVRLPHPRPARPQHRAKARDRSDSGLADFISKGSRTPFLWIMLC